MRKEIFFAILAGALFGLVIAFGIWRANSQLKTNGQTDEMTSVEESLTPSPESEVGLTMAKPDDLSVFTENPVTISGITDPGNWVSISGESDDYIIQADQNGAFEKDVDLEAGANVIVITAFDKAGGSNTQTLTAVYSSEFVQ